MVICVSLCAGECSRVCRGPVPESCPLSVEATVGKKELKRVRVRVCNPCGELHEEEASCSCIAFQVRDSMRGGGSSLHAKYQCYTENAARTCCGELSGWEDFCLGAACYIALYQLLECRYFCDLPFPVCLPVCFSAGIFTCHLMHYMHMVAAALARFACPMLAQLAGVAAEFCALYRLAFVEGCRVDECLVYRQTLDIVGGASDCVQAACLEVQSRAAHINVYLDTLEKKVQHRLDMAVGRMQREVHNLSVDLQTQIATRLAVAQAPDPEPEVFPSILPSSSQRTIPGSALAASDKSIFL